MEIKNTTPKLLVKFKNIQIVFDYCLENRLKFTVAPRLNNDEWEVELNIADVMSAIALGIFVRENKIEVIGLNYGAPKTQAALASKVAKPVKTVKSLDLNEELMVNTNTLLDIEIENASFQEKAELAF